MIFEESSSERLVRVVNFCQARQIKMLFHGFPSVQELLPVGFKKFLYFFQGSRVQRVPALLAIGLYHHQVRLPQVFKVLGHGRLTKVGSGNQHINRAWFLPNGVE
jgi:hypothetical protein